ncbi:MAG TPA: DUF3857 domain-containing protein [Phycisphaerae bacterium]|nr:DUF3857 domain-containing protein [Phycisphaerae bacterium]
MPKALFHLPRRLTIAAALVIASPALAAPPRPVTDADIQAAISAAAERDFKDADWAVLIDDADVYVNTTGLATTKQCEVIKILTDAGARRQCVQRFDFDPATRRVHVTAARVHRQDGTVDDLPLDAIAVQPTVQHMIYWGGRQYLLSIPRLAVGDVIELHTRKTGFNIAYLGDDDAPGTAQPAGNAAETLQPPMPGHWYEVTLFAGHQPIVHKRYSVHLSSKMPVQYAVYNGSLQTSQWFEDKGVVHTFVADDVPAIESEPHMIDLNDCATKVVMATVPDWEMKSRWFHDVNEGQFEADDAIRQTVAKITKGLTSLDDRIAACNHWVADNIRYYGTSRGPCEGFTLHKGTETYRDRGGVCKDKAGMLVTMLRVLGVEAYPALTMAGSRVEDIPADQFNHTVTVMKDQDGEWRILDPTWIPLSREMWSSREALQGLVYGTPEGETLTLSPYYPPSYNRLACAAQSQIDADGKLTTAITMNMSGYPDTYLRRYLERDWQPDMKGVFASRLNFGPTARVDDLHYTDPYDYTRDAQVRMEVSAPAYAASGTDLCMLHLPLMTHPLSDWLIPDALYDLNAESRQYGMRLRATREIDYREAIELPDGWSVAEVPQARTITSPSADLSFEASSDGNRLTYHFKLDLKKHIVPPEDYAKFRESIQAMKDITAAWVICRSGSAESTSAQAALVPTQQEVHHD